MREYILQTQKYQKQLNSLLGMQQSLMSMLPSISTFESPAVKMLRNSGISALIQNAHSINSISKRTLDLYKPMNFFMQNEYYRKYFANQLQLSKIISQASFGNLATAQSLTNNYFDISRNHLRSIADKKITFPSESVVTSALKQDLEESGFYTAETTEEALQVVEKKIEETKNKEEWLNAVYIWLLAFIVNYLIQLTVNYAIKGEFEMSAPSIDMSMFVAKLMNNNSYRYVIVDSLAVKEIPRQKSKTIDYLKIEQEVKIIRKRKDWSLVSYQDGDVIKEGWVLSRYIEK